MKHKKTYIICSLLVILTMTIGLSVAYFTDFNSKLNVFTTGNVSISLTEPKYDMQDNIYKRSSLSPSEVIIKDPTITNIGDLDAYVFLEIIMPRTDRAIIDDNGQKISNGYTDAFNFTVKGEWVQVEKEIMQLLGRECCRYVYAYAEGDAVSGNMIALKKGQSAPTIFEDDMLVHKNFIEPENLANYDLKIRAYGIQRDDFLDVSNLEGHHPAIIWDKAMNQLNMEGVK